MRSACFVLVVLACSDPTPAHREPEPVPIAAPRAVRDRAAFAMVPSDDGALLVWGAQDALYAQVLGAHGEEAGERVEIARIAALEVEAGAVGRRVGVGWIAADLRIGSAFSRDGGRSFAAPEALGESVALPRGHRGRLAVGANDEGRMTLWHRRTESACVGAEMGPCARIARHGISAPLPATERGLEMLEVRHPCDPLVSGTRWSAGTWYYAICDREHSTIYAIRDAINWAAPIEVPCVPAGIVPLDHGVAAFTRCADGSEVVHVLDAMGAPMARLAPPERSVSCAEGRPALSIGAGRTLSLAGAVDHLEPLLAESIAPRGARAIWTGEAVLVALVRGSSLQVRRYECAHDRFERSDPGPSPRRSGG